MPRLNADTVRAEGGGLARETDTEGDQDRSAERQQDHCGRRRSLDRGRVRAGVAGPYADEEAGQGAGTESDEDERHATRGDPRPVGQQGSNVGVRAQHAGARGGAGRQHQPERSADSSERIDTVCPPRGSFGTERAISAIAASARTASRKPAAPPRDSTNCWVHANGAACL
ncbi:hypothetical protein ACFRCI_47570 [Streptomyces sp. NPDC056638]|uniref:hypothetical protein n=1 Tax=Streptomyces sp. NPDC056638 TaxID=3345887 RepID=UPI0036D0388B